METLRRRVPFKLTGDQEEEEDHILDEQGMPQTFSEFTASKRTSEQDEVINRLRAQNAVSETQNRLLFQVLLGISTLVQLIYLLDPSKDTPLSSIFPVLEPYPHPIPLSTVFTLLSIAIHGNLFLLCRRQTRLLVNLGLPNGLPLVLTYPLSAVAPTLALFLRKPWQITLWWCITPTITFITQAVLDAIDMGNNSVSELEAMKYRAAGA